MNENPISTYDDEIDLRAILQTLWKRRWPILGLTLFAALAAFAVSAWVLPKKYQAAAYITIGQPAVRYQNQGGLSVAPVVPDIKALPELAQAGYVLEQVASDSRVAPLLASDASQWRDDAQVSTFGTSQIRLQITDTDPKRAAVLANVWAEKAADWIELNYGLGALASSLDEQSSQAQQSYAQAQSVLETFIAQDTTSILQSQLTSQIGVYSCLQTQSESANAILSRMGDLKKRLIQSDETLPLSDALLLASIQQDMFILEACNSTGIISQPSSVSGTLRQVDSNAGIVFQSFSPMVFAGISSSQGLDVISALDESLQLRIANAQARQDALQKTTMKLQIEIEHLNYQRTSLTYSRDQAETLHEQLTFQKSLIETVLAKSGRVADVSSKAVAPRITSSPNSKINTVTAGTIGLMLSAVWVFLQSWWLGSADKKQEKIG